MLKHTRRRALGLLIAAAACVRLALTPRAIAQEDSEEIEETEETETEEVDCYDSKDFGPWKAQASDQSAGAVMQEVPAVKPGPCHLAMELQVNADFDAKVFLAGDPELLPLPEEFLVKPENRLLAKTAAGTVVVDEALCGNCTDIYDDAVGIVLPLATAPLFRDEDSFELAIRLDGKDEDCRFKIDAATLRKALDWAVERREALIKDEEDNKCASAEGCFITTACCETLGLDDDCFELRWLRHYRDQVLAKQPEGAAAIARYYVLAPQILARMPAAMRGRSLRSVYARYVLPASLAARLGLNALAYRLYQRMLDELTRKHVPETDRSFVSKG